MASLSAFPEISDSESCLYKMSIETPNSTEDSMLSPSHRPGCAPKSKRIRKNQKDFFDYQAHINRELQKLNVSSMSEEEKKQAIIRIRNRMSAQRSRTRQRERLAEISDYSQDLVLRNQELEKKNQELLALLMVQKEPDSAKSIELENEARLLRESLLFRMEEEKKLRQRLVELEMENETLRREKEMKWTRTSNPVEKTSISKTMLFFFGIVMLTLMFMGKTDAVSMKTMGVSFNDLGLKSNGTQRVSCKVLSEQRKAFEALKTNTVGRLPDWRLFKFTRNWAATKFDDNCEPETL